MVTVLVVDDDDHLRELYELELPHYGYDVVLASSGQEALAAIEGREVHVVVLDIAMPVMDGIDALGRILAVENQLPVILNTAYASYKEDFMTWAAEAYIIKSSDLAELVAALDKALEKRGIPVPERGER